MSQSLNTDNIDEELKRNLKPFFDDISNRLNRVEQMVKEDLNVDKQDLSSDSSNKVQSPNLDGKIDNIQSQISKINVDLTVLKNSLIDITNRINYVIQQLTPVNDRFPRRP